MDAHSLESLTPSHLSFEAFKCIYFEFFLDLGNIFCKRFSHVEIVSIGYFPLLDSPVSYFSSRGVALLFFW